MGVTMSILSAIAVGALSSFVAAECIIGADPLALWLIRRSVCFLPPTVRGRYEEEWTSALHEIQSPTLKLAHSLSLFFSAPKIGSALRTPGVPFTVIFAVRACDIGFAIFFPPLILISGVTVALRLLTVRTPYTMAVFVGRDGREFKTIRFSRRSSLGSKIFDVIIALPHRIFQVLVGNLSFVGPRPLTLKEASLGRILCVRPGLFPVRNSDFQIGVGIWFRTVTKVMNAGNQANLEMLREFLKWIRGQ